MGLRSAVQSLERRCIHSTTELLGADGMAEFYRCRTCQRVIILQGKQSWIIRPSVSA